MKNFSLLLFLLLSASGFSQIKGTVTDEQGLPLPFVNIFVENTYNSTTTNDLGIYEINVKNPGKYTVVFQYLGFKTQRKTVDADKFPQTLNIVLVEESFNLDDVVIDPKINRADPIIRSAIRSKKENSERTARFRADFYSRGIIRIKDM
ncbi:MAG TPA: carboxypeptidase-like regulatory domain-containing protein, partial [Flavobacterium sp.]